MDSERPQHRSFKPGEIWRDTAGVHINAHGGGFYYENGVYYWFGEHKIAGEAGNTAQVGVGVYNSSDLYNWKNEGIALHVVDDPSHEIAKGSIIERPKVVRSRHGKYVMWFHLELFGQGYNAARVGVAVADHVTGPYRYLHSFRPNGFMSRDMTLFVDDDGRAYHFAASDDNATLRITLLTDDCLGVTPSYTTAFTRRYMEAPAVWKQDGKYYLIASDCTGWAPNPARIAVADHPFGPWTELGNPCIGEKKETTFDSQSTYILPVALKKTFIYCGDRWRPKDAIDGRYIWLPLAVKDGKPELIWRDEWDLSIFD